MNMGVKCSDLSSFNGYWFPFMEEHQLRSWWWFRKFLEGLVQQRGQEHIPKVSGMTNCGFRSSREIIPEQRDEPLGLDIVLPVESDQFQEDLWMRSGLLMDPLEFLIQKCPWGSWLIHSRWSWMNLSSIGSSLVICLDWLGVTHWYH